MEPSSAYLNFWIMSKPCRCKLSISFTTNLELHVAKKNFGFDVDFSPSRQTRVSCSSTIAYVTV